MLTPEEFMSVKGIVQASDIEPRIAELCAALNAAQRSVRYSVVRGMRVTYSNRHTLILFVCELGANITSFMKGTANSATYL